ncbi:Outer dense fiber protein 2 84 kDa outer dense fiber protein [Triplophysa tibetana]|uniref:Outer dense fiber protein 2 n=1 Tax=Triplophysa tibetana TaxID=1572043 RepID=A0A5A9PFY5_9TELE|nr:Outer dense fiber protein 2 84 kDa outer dense fiber protein [Triplophysa tibetana]
MRRSMRTRSSSPPLHVHVNESTPVHMHVNKTSNSSPTKTPQVKPKSGLRPTPKVRTRVPWIPPGKVSTRETSYKWEGHSHRLEITPLSEPKRSQSPLRIEDLSTDEEDALHGRINQYEKKIDSLMTEVSSLKNEVELRKKEQLIERQSERLNASQRVIDEQEEELAEVARELEATEEENSRLRESMEKMIVDSDFARLERSCPQLDKDALLRKLLEAEMDSNAAAKQVSALRETVSQMSRNEKRLSGSDTSHVARQKELLLQKLETFEGTNRALRNLLREQHNREMDSLRLLEQKDALLKRLTDVEAENSDKDIEVNQLSSMLDNEKENSRTTTELSKVLEATRAHLQGQLRNKESENSRLNVQIRNLERTVSQQKGEIDHLQEQLQERRQRAEADKEALKKATRAQKQRAQRSEDTVGQLSAQLMEIEAQLTDAVLATENWSSRHAKETKDRAQLEMEITLMNSRITDLMEQLQEQEEKARSERDGLLNRLHELTTDSSSVRLGNQSLKATLSALEEKLTLSQSEVHQIKVSVKQYESLVDSYKIQVQKTRAEADEYCARLQVAEREAQMVREELDQEIQQVRKQLLGRLAELEPLPEALTRTELQLQEAHEKERSQERRSTELSTALAELRIKVDQQGSQAEMVKHKNMVLLEESKQLQHKAEALERKFEEATSQNRDLLQVIAKREETIHSNQVRLEEKSRECSILTRQLEEALEDARRQVTQTRERASSKERATHSKVVDLETQLSRTTSELNQLRRAKEEAERRYQSRLQDVKDRLEQSDSTNRSLQNYVQFLKSSYANVFGDTALAGSSFHTPSPI